MKRLTGVLTAALLMAVMTMATGCSKEESGNEPMPEPAPQHKVTKENIVGVWRSGDYWVSFSEDGYNSAYFPIESDKRIDEGEYTIDGDTISVSNSLFYSWTRYIINSISSTTLSLTIIYNFFGSTSAQGDNYDVTQSLTLTKTGDTPSRKMDLDGMSFLCESTFYNYKTKTTYNVTQLCEIWSEYHLIRFQNRFKSEAEEKIDGNYLSGGKEYYIYLSPYIYTTLLHTDRYERNTFVIKGELSFGGDGNLNYIPVN